MTINERLLFLIKKMGMNVNSFSVKANIHAQTTDRIVRGLNKPKFEYLSQVLSTYREINTDWLMREEGEPLVKDHYRKTEQDQFELISLRELANNHKKLIIIYENELNHLRSEVEKLKEKLNRHPQEEE